jgi:plastocyanin
MPEILMISIDDTGFTPPSPTVEVGDQIFWRNNTSSPHLPRPKNGGANDWLDNEIPAKLPTQPAPTSPYIFFTGPMEADYVCDLHPNETGTIIVVKGDDQ